MSRRCRSSKSASRRCSRQAPAQVKERLRGCGGVCPWLCDVWLECAYVCTWCVVCVQVAWSCGMACGDGMCDVCMVCLVCCVCEHTCVVCMVCDIVWYACDHVCMCGGIHV